MTTLDPRPATPLSPDGPDSDPDPAPGRPVRRAVHGRTTSRRTRTLDVVVGGRGGPRSRVWTVTAPRSGAADVVVSRETANGEVPGPTRTVQRAGRRLVLPESPPGAAADPALGAAAGSPAPGWHVGAVLVVPLPALCTDGFEPVPDGTRRVAGPPPGHHVQIVLLLGDAWCEPLDLPAAQNAGALLLPGGDRVQLWSHHVPSGPSPAGRRRTATTTLPGAVGGVPVVLDPGSGPGSHTWS